MYAAAIKSNKENNSRVVANSVSQQKNKQGNSGGFVDNRPGAKTYKRIQGIMQLRAKPILANERNLLGDTEKVIRGQKRTQDKHLIDTTYDNVSDNLLLDLNMQYEEELQREIEHEGYFTSTLKNAVNVIHDTGKIHSLDKTTTEDTSKSKRIDSAISKIKKTTGNEGITKYKLTEGKFDPKLLTQNEDPEIQRMNVGYVKLIKMLETQVPYFGGSVEYAKDIKDSFEYWVYHLSTLTKDPDRSYKIGESGSKLLKPMKDYRTHKGLVPLHNQRNLGTGIIEAKWNELPTELKEKIVDNLNFLFTKLGTIEYPYDRKARLAFWLKGGSALNLEESAEKKMHIRERDPMKEISPEKAGSLWNNLEEEEKKQLYGDVVQIPWSDSHLHEGSSWEQTQMHTELRKDLDFRKLPYKTSIGLENVVGVKGNILETPKVASEKYQKELSEKYESGHVPQENFEGYKVDIDTKLSSGHILQNYFIIESLVTEFKDKHQDWYNKTRKYHKPIVGGISGHTLGYLNLYSDAQMQYPSFDSKWPSMEALRACMLGALIGDKRHHSYDEVMTASDGMPYRTNYGSHNLHYFFRTSYEDVLTSKDTKIKSTAKKAQSNTKTNGILINENSVAKLIMDIVDFDNNIYKLLKEIIEEHCEVFGLATQYKLNKLNEAISKKMESRFIR
jgi:hypothetical protein